MPRRRQVPKREILPDPKFNSVELAKFINTVMRSGKKSIAERIVYAAMTRIEDMMKKQKVQKDDDQGDSGEGGAKSAPKNPLDLFSNAIENVRPVVEVRSRRVGGATYQIPVEVPAHRRTALSMRWIIEAAKKRGEKTMAMRLANELMDAAMGRGEAMKVRENVHRMAKANQAFAHFRW